MRVAAAVKQPSRSRAPPSRAAPLHPFQGERQISPSSAEIGEGSPAHPPQLVEPASSSLALEGEGWGEGGCFGQAAKPKSSTIRQGRRSSPSPRRPLQNPASTSKAGRIFTLSEGRGRIGRPRPNSVRGLPRTHPNWSKPPLSPSPLRERAGVRVAASVKQPSRSRAPSARAAALHPLPGDLRKTPPPPRKRGGSSPSPRGEADSAVLGGNR